MTAITLLASSGFTLFMSIPALPNVSASSAVNVFPLEPMSFNSSGFATGRRLSYGANPDETSDCPISPLVNLSLSVDVGLALGRKL